MKAFPALRWVVEPLCDHPTYCDRPMFGGRAVYFGGRLVLFLAMKAEPWRGLLVPTEREVHALLQAEFPALGPHPVLPKWLYLPESGPSFERDAETLVAHIRALDPRIGVQPKPARSRRPIAEGPRRRRAHPSSG